MDWWQWLSLAAWRFIDEHGQLGVFLFLLVEEAGTPIPIPGDFLMALAGARAAQGRLNVFEILAVMELATVIGASCLYWLSARAGRKVVYRLGRHIGLTAERLDSIGKKINERGAMGVVIGRLTPGLRLVTPIACGVFGFPFRVYLPAMAVGAFLYILVYTLLGYFFGPRLLHLLETFELPLGLILSTLSLGGLVFWVVRAGKQSTPPERCPDLRERMIAGATGGLVGTLVAALLANVLINLLGLLTFRAPAQALTEFSFLVSRVGRAPGLAAAVVVMPALLGFGAVLGAAYGAWLGNAGHVNGTLRGAAFGLLPLGFSLLILLPLVGAGPAGLSLQAGLVPAAGETVRHLTFGLVMGTLYPALARPRKVPQPLSSPTKMHPTPSSAATP